MYPARTRNLCEATSASAGASRNVGINSSDQRCIVFLSTESRVASAEIQAKPHSEGNSLFYLSTARLSGYCLGGAPKLQVAEVAKRGVLAWISGDKLHFTT